MKEDLRRELLEFLNELREEGRVFASDMKYIDTLISKLQEETND